MDLETAIAYEGANKQTDLVNKRGAAETEDAVGGTDLQKNQFLSKFKKDSFVVQGDDSNLVEEERLGGALYLPVKKDVAPTWKAVLEALQSLENCDINVEEQENFNAYGLQYYHDTFMLARTKLCKLDGEEGSFLEIHRLEGDGFVFSDEFKKNLIEKLESMGDFVQDVDTVEPIPSENAKDGILNFLDLSDDTIAADMIQHWLTTLKPKGGVKYDHRHIYETMSCLGWNCNDKDNFAVLAEYSDHIVGPILEILRHPETTFVPTAYFGAMCLDKFVSGNAIPVEVKTWNSVFMLVEIMEKFCVNEKPANVKGIADMQVTRSREVLRLLVSILEKFVPIVSGDQPAAMAGKVKEVLTGLENTLNKESLDSLRFVLEGANEEEVEAA